MTNENVETKDLVILNKMTPEKLFSEEGKEFVLEGVQSHIKDFVYDLSSKKGRTETNAMSRRIGGLQKSIDDLKKQTTAEWKEKAKKIDSGSKAIVDALELIKQDFRKPLTELELFEAECEERFNVARGIVQRIYNSFADLDVAKKQLDDAFKFDFKDRKVDSQNAFVIAESHLLAVSEMLNRKQEAEIAEKAAKEQAEKERITQEALENARIVAKQEAEASLEKERELLRQAQSKQEEEAKRAEREKAEQARREADYEHRKTVNNAIVASLAEIGIDAEIAKTLIVSIIGGKIPNLTIKY